MVLYDIVLTALHYGYMAIVEFFVDVSDQYVTHYVVVIVMKAGVVHVGYKVIKHVHVHWTQK